MKNKLLLIAVIGLLFASCEEELNIPPNDSLIADTAFQNIIDIETGLNGAYSSHNPTNGIRFNSVFTDNTQIGAFSGGQGFNIHSLILNSNSGEPNAIWVSSYEVINRANRVIQAAANIEIEAADQNRLDHALGQCYGLRALAHYDLFTYFTEDYTNTSGLSAAVVTDVVTIENRARNTVAEIVAQIKADIAQAKSLLDNSLAANQYVNEDMLIGLEARLALFTGDNTGAKAAADNLIAKYALADQTQYADMWLDQNDSEVIFRRNILADGAGIGFTWTFNSGDPFLEVSNSLIGEMFLDDVRTNSLVNVDRFLNIDGVAVVNKYPGASALFVNDIKLMRVSEMYLIAAEAAAKSSMLTEAADYVKAVLDARFADDLAVSFGSTADALSEIITQRRLELGFEGHRYLDLKRFGLGLNRAADDCSNLNNACSMAASDHRFTLPIPVDELNANDLMVQNSGY